MKRLILIVTACVFSLVSSKVSFADETQTNQFSGAYLLYLCEMDARGQETVKGGHTACQAYIAGVIDYHRMLQSMKLAPELNICVPPKTSANTLHKTVLAFLRARKEHDGFIAAPAVTMALYKAYPCQNPREKKKK